MKTGLFCAALMSVLSVPTIASAAAESATAASAEVGHGTRLFSSDGWRIGLVDRVIKNKDGTPRAVAVIYGSKFIHIPYDTLSQGEKGATTSLTRKDLSKL